MIELTRALVQWVVSDYGVLLGRLGIVESDLQPPLLEALEPVFSEYTKHVKVSIIYSPSAY